MLSVAFRRATGSSTRRIRAFTASASNPALDLRPASVQAALSQLPLQLTGPTGASSMHLPRKGHTAPPEPSLPFC